LTGEVLGGMASTTGIGAAIGVPAMVVSTGLVVGGLGNIGAGIRGLMTTGSGSTGSQGTAPAAGGGVRVNKVDPHPEAQGPHTSFKRDPTTGKVTGYTEFDAAGNPVKRFRGEGKPHGGIEPPLVLERAPGKNPPSPLNRARPANSDELPKDY
jgi:hypothetical protein